MSSTDLLYWIIFESELKCHVMTDALLSESIIQDKPLTLNGVDLIEIGLDETEKLALLGAKINSSDYSPENISANPYILPTNVNRYLVSPSCIGNLKKGVENLGIGDSFKLGIVRQQLGSESFIPLHFISMFEYNGFNFVSPIFISTLHHVMKSSAALEKKASVISYYLNNYFEQNKQFDFTIMGMPSLKPGSNTKDLLTSISGSPVQTLFDGYVSRDLFFFANNFNAQAHRQAFMNDPDLLTINAGILGAWSENLAMCKDLDIEDMSIIKSQIESVVRSLLAI